MEMRCEVGGGGAGGKGVCVVCMSRERGRMKRQGLHVNIYRYAIEPFIFPLLFLCCMVRFLFGNPPVLTFTYPFIAPCVMPDWLMGGWMWNLEDIWCACYI